jgi:hypothetical protein
MTTDICEVSPLGRRMGGKLKEHQYISLKR